MLRPLSLLPALVAVTATLVVPVGAQARPPAADETPLAVTIDALAPSYIPNRGRIRITGSVTNNDETAWTTVNVYAVIGREPITTSADLAAAADLEPTADVADRITTPNAYDTIDRIEPGESAQFSVRVPRSAIDKTDPGVYWFGVHALGSGPDGRVGGADGRARTFVPLVPRTRRTVDTALVVPLRQRIAFTFDGRLADVADWTRSLSTGGRLRSIVDFGASAGSRPITWLVDPALPDAVRRLAAGNPPRSLAADDQEEPGAEGSEGPSAGAEPSPDSSASASPEPGAASQVTVDAANAWLERLSVALQSSQILVLPYGDLDLPAAARLAPSTYERARRRSDGDTAPGALRSPAVAPPRGFLDEPGLRLAERDATVLLSDLAFVDVPPPVARIQGHRIVPTSSGAASGGPGPDDPAAPVAVRQRIVSEAALRLIEPGRRPLVVQLPSAWVPATTTGFFEGLDPDWINLTSVAGATNVRPARRVPVSGIEYPEALTRLELRPGLFAAVNALIRAGETLDAVLTRNDSVAQTVADQGLASLSYGNRRRPRATRASVERSRRWIEDRLASVRIEAPRRVTLSSASGRFAASLVNDLDQPVTVGIEAVSDQQMTISGPATVDIPAGGRSTVLLNARTRQLGIHNVRLVVTDINGTPLGSSDQVPIRAAQVSAVIWLILGTGVALLFGAIAVRLVRRVRASTRAARATAPAPRLP